MKGYRFIASDDTSEFCHRVTEAISNGWKVYGAKIGGNKSSFKKLFLKFFTESLLN